MMDRIVPAYVRSVQIFTSERKGMTILDRYKIARNRRRNTTLHVEGKDDIIASKALLSIGRSRPWKVLGMLSLIHRGRIKVNEYMETCSRYLRTSEAARTKTNQDSLCLVVTVWRP